MGRARSHLKGIQHAVLPVVVGMSLNSSEGSSAYGLLKGKTQRWLFCSAVAGIASLPLWAVLHYTAFSLTALSTSPVPAPALTAQSTKPYLWSRAHHHFITTQRPGNPLGGVGELADHLNSRSVGSILTRGGSPQTNKLWLTPALKRRVYTKDPEPFFLSFCFRATHKPPR